MAHTFPKIIVAAAAAMLFTTGVAQANSQVKRVAPQNSRSSLPVKPSKCPTAVYASGQGIANERVGSATRSKDHTTRIQLGRGQYIPVRSNSR